MNRSVSRFLLVVAVLFVLTGCSTDAAGPQEPAVPEEAGMASGWVPFPAVKLPYTMEQAVQNKDVVVMPNGDKNRDQWDAFVQRYEEGQPAQVRIVYYTDEGDPILNELRFDQDRIYYTYDNTMDAFAGRDNKKRTQTVCASLNIPPAIRGDGKKHYALQGCRSAEGSLFSFPVEDAGPDNGATAKQNAGLVALEQVSECGPPLSTFKRVYHILGEAPPFTVSVIRECEPMSGEGPRMTKEFKYGIGANELKFTEEPTVH
ncbi:DUF4362 domain-containing protein [Paenibacillus sp. JX-17]|uniref:DUF4362 domain-containing protein n=1 Tax=Paenibacillus lacisoli TaxID=3064525 RepID=A0ABT9CC47_9BACL|nr:DUF4362 domain-containing protein [Paenibacillus sp. JX-17]MDO7906842.1 DUF4362 domain-containing protein [Paenibacillus sp. JX-17]